MAFWNKEIETMPREDLEKMQLSLLRRELRTMYDASPFIHDKLRSVNLLPEDIDSFAAFRKVPFMVKSDLRDHYPDRLFVRPYSDLVRIHVSSGTTGHPTVVGYTQRDLDNWTESLARGMTSFGLTRNDVFQNMHGYGLFTGGLGAHYGAERVGATVLPASTGNTERQLEMMQDLSVTAIACTPSYLMHLCTTARQMGIDWHRDMCLKKAVLGAEPWSESMRVRLQNEMGIKAYDIYGTSEQAGPMFSECEAQKGAHIWGDTMLVEILDRDTGEPLEPGNEGEMVVTMLKKEAMPMIRYRTKDLTTLHTETCECGRTSPRISRITGRSDDMLIIRGINVFPSQIEYTLMRIPQVGDQYMILVTREGDLDRMVLQVEIKPEAFSDKVEDMIALRSHIESQLKKYLNIAVEVELKAPGELPRFDGKAKRVIDKRVI